MKNSKKLISIILSLVLIFSTVITTSYAEDELFQSFNIKHYSTDRYGSVVSSQLHYDGDKLIRAEIGKNAVYIEEFDKNYNLKSSYSVNGELENICGVYIGSTDNFVVCSQQNPTENDSVEVVRIIKFSKTWKRIASASIFGANTYIFADAGSLRFAEYGNYLYVRSCHEMYTTSDGLHHQANMTFVVDTNSMTVTHDNYQISNRNNGYVSHSFNQFIAIDEDTNSVIAVDHGDAYPRSIIMFRYKNQLGADELTNPQSIDLFYIEGVSGDNVTGVTVSDIIVTDNNYIVAFNSTPQDNISVTRNIYLAIVPKDSFKSESVNLIKLTDYTGRDNTVCGYPYITDIGNGEYSLIWEANALTEDHNTTYYTTIDENGNLLSQIKSFEAYLSDCEPVFVDNKVIWYSTFNSEPVFYYVNDADAGVDCDKYELIYEKIIPVKWEYSEYFSTDTELHISVTNNNAVLSSIDVASDTSSLGYSTYGSNITIFTYNNPGTYYLYATFSNGKVIKKSVIVKDVAEKNNITPDNCTHSYRATNIQNVTCTTSGITEYICNYCNYSYKENIPALGHIDSNNNNSCDNCHSTIDATAKISADKSTYNILEDECAVITIECDDGVWIEKIATTESCYAYQSIGNTLYYYFCECGTVTLTITLTDGQVLSYDIIVTDNNNPPETETNPPETTKPESFENPENKPSDDSETILKGDFDKNGSVSPSDARSVLRIAALLDVAPANIITLADMDNNGIITTSDARTILRIAVGLE